MIAENPKHQLTGFVRKASVQTSPQEQLSANWGFASSISLSFSNHPYGHVSVIFSHRPACGGD
jgi:hypothetical protein